MPEQTIDALACHDGVLRSAIEVPGGRVFKAIEDACCAAFDVGPDVDRAARRLSTGYGGQLLVSKATFETLPVLPAAGLAFGD